jgi:hypothetical protein
MCKPAFGLLDSPVDRIPIPSLRAVKELSMKKLEQKVFFFDRVKFT